jgi:hypothetical protein
MHSSQHMSKSILPPSVYDKCLSKKHKDQGETNQARSPLLQLPT